MAVGLRLIDPTLRVQRGSFRNKEGCRHWKNKTMFIGIILIVGNSFWWSWAIQATHHDLDILDDHRLLTTKMMDTTQSETAATAFSKLQLFISAYPGSLKESGKHPPPHENINGFIELRETFLRTLQFFWPQNPHWKLTVVLDEPANPEHRLNLTEQVFSLFDDPVDARDWVSVAFNPLTNHSLYGSGWYIQQLIMLWADNFTDAEYIGFVDDDTIITKAVEPIDIFDERGRPRALVVPDNEGWNKIWSESVSFSFGRPSSVFAMTYFPVVVKRDHFRRVRDEILKVHRSEYSHFDEFYSALIHRRQPEEELTGICQFCILMDYAFERHLHEYSWHFESQRRNDDGRNLATAVGTVDILEMTEPVPRITIHASYMFWLPEKVQLIKTVDGRRILVSEIMRQGYCYSLPWPGKLSWIDQDRCRYYDVQSGIYGRGEWQFERRKSPWYRLHLNDAKRAHRKRAEQNTIRTWDERVLTYDLFGAEWQSLLDAREG